MSDNTPRRDTPEEKMRASPARLRSLADRLAGEGDAETAMLVRRAADELDAAREPHPDRPDAPAKP